MMATVARIARTAARIAGIGGSVSAGRQRRSGRISCPGRSPQAPIPRRPAVALERPLHGERRVDVEHQAHHRAPRRAPTVVRALASIALAALAGGGLAPAAAEDTRDVLGVTHVAGRYNFTGEDFLNEGADQLLELGTRVIKVWFTPDIATRYPFNSSWGTKPANLAELAQRPYFQTLFAKPFSTYVLVFESVNPVPQDLSAGIPTGALQIEQQETHDLAAYLLTAYAGTGKTFVLQNWEGDHLLRAGLAPEADPSPQRVMAMAQWWNAHQDGVTMARAEAAARGVNVYHAIEVNALADAMRGKVTATNDVLPFTYADLYSYSSWDVEFDPDTLSAALDYLQSKAPPSALLGRRNIYLGEFGAAKDQVPDNAQRPAMIRRLTTAALAWGVRYALYWELYCNEPAHPFTDRPGNSDMRGFWLIRPDGVKTAMWSDIRQRLPSMLYRLALRAPSGEYLVAAGSGGGALQTGSTSLGPWKVFAVTAPGGQPLHSGQPIYLQTHNGMYVHAERGLLGTVVAGDWDPDRSRSLVIRKVSGDAGIDDGDLVTLQTASGRYVRVDAATGAVLANRTAPGPDSTFRVEIQP
jgi:hypothetical protein